MSILRIGHQVSIRGARLAYDEAYIIGAAADRLFLEVDAPEYCRNLQEPGQYLIG
jgi:hypothetical protein